MGYTQTDSIHAAVILELSKALGGWPGALATHIVHLGKT